jgi:hypothetical protein
MGEGGVRGGSIVTNDDGFPKHAWRLVAHRHLVADHGVGDN